MPPPALPLQNSSASASRTALRTAGSSSEAAPITTRRAPSFALPRRDTRESDFETRSSAVESDWRQDSTLEPIYLPRNPGEFWHHVKTEVSYRSWMLRLRLREISRDPPRLGALVALVALVIWSLVACALLVIARETYEGSSADAARLRFVQARALQVASEASKVFRVAIEVYDAMHYAVQRKLYFEPLEYGVLDSVLTPLFVSHNALRSVDLAFSGRPYSLSARKLWRENMTNFNHTERIMQLQSNHSDCHERLGRRGCLSGIPGRDQEWYSAAIQLPAGQESEYTSVSGYKDLLLERLGSAFKWMDSPRIVPQDQNTSVLAGCTLDSSGDDASSSLTWEPAYSLVFRTAFPGSRGRLTLVGRATVTVDDLTQPSIVADPEHLGAEGSICIVDKKGNLIAAENLGSLLYVQSGTGRARFRYLWELNTPWARSTQDLDLTSSGVHHLQSEGFRVVVAPLTGRGLGQFRVVVAAQLYPFLQPKITSLLGRGIVAVILPYPVAAFLLLVGYLYYKYRARKAMNRVKPAESAPETPLTVSAAETRRSMGRGLEVLDMVAAKSIQQRTRDAGRTSARVSMINKRGGNLF